MMIKVHSIRFRLTFYFLLIFIGLFVFVSAIVLYNFKSNAINKGRNSLRDKSFVIGAWIDFANPDFNGQVDDYIGSQEAQLMIRLYDRDKNLLGSSSGFKGDYKLLDEAAAEVESKDEPYLYESEDGLYLIAVNNLYYNDQIKGFVQLFILKDSILHNYYYLFRVILIAGIASLVIAFLAGIFLVDQMLKPINKIMDIVNKIQAEKLDKTRLEINNPHDEIGRLSSTINDLLNRIQVAISNQRKFLSDAAHELRTPLTILK
ncbi:MAG TPA: HAMP domain-containing protein, partial [Cytophagaceae bacterium]